MRTWLPSLCCRCVSVLPVLKASSMLFKNLDTCSYSGFRCNDARLTFGLAQSCRHLVQSANSLYVSEIWRHRSNWSSLTDFSVLRDWRRISSQRCFRFQIWYSSAIGRIWKAVWSERETKVHFLVWLPPRCTVVFTSGQHLARVFSAQAATKKCVCVYNILLSSFYIYQINV